DFSARLNAVLSTLDLPNRDIVDFLTENYRADQLFTIQLKARRGEITSLDIQKIEEILVGGYFEGSGDDIRKYIEISNAKRTIEATKLDGLNIIVRDILMAACDYTIRTGYNPFPSVLHTSHLMAYRTARLGRRLAPNLTADYQSRLFLPKDHLSMQEIIAGMSQDKFKNGKDFCFFQELH
ncbi:MAG: hypothetical protein ACMG6E_00370, partial [Candidatus Roizmanbacteria bacterium]